MTTDGKDDPRIEETVSNFAQMFLGGIPPIITHDSAFMSFICMLSGIEALAGFRYSVEESDPGKRFECFVDKYFPPEYKQFCDKRLWLFRCRMVHSFSPAGFSLIHHHSEVHLRTHAETGKPVLNAEDFFAALLFGAQAYFKELRADEKLRRYFSARLDDKRKGGTIGVGPAKLSPTASANGMTTTDHP